MQTHSAWLLLELMARAGVQTPRRRSDSDRAIHLEDWLPCEGGRSTGGSDGEEDAAVRELETEGPSRVVEMCRTRGGRDIDAGAENARGAGGTVLRRAEMTEQVVVFEMGRDKEDGVKRYADERPTISRPASHLNDDITGR